MDQITILCTVSVSDAIKAGRNKAGRYDHPLAEAEASDLVKRKLAGVAAAFMRGAPGTSGFVVERLKVTEPSWSGIVAALEALRSPAADARMQRQRELDMLAEWGKKVDYDRHAEGLLHEDELLAVARRVAFTRYANWVRYDKQARLSASDVNHATSCTIGRKRRDEQERLLEYETTKAPDLSEEAWVELGEIRKIAERANCDAPVTAGMGKFALDLRRHNALCPECEKGAYRDTVMVTVTWCGRTLSREFLLRG